VNWDRWVSQDDVYEPTEKIQQYAARILQEHKDLSNRLASSKPGKKKRQTIDGNTFLSQWRLRLERIDAEMEMYNPLISPFSNTAAAIAITKKQKQSKDHGDDDDMDNDDDKKSKKGKQRGRQQQSDSSNSFSIDRWSTATLTAEMQNRSEHNLTTLRPSSTVASKKLVLPFALHKILVDQWEIISQCGMLPALPAPVTVRQVLDRYLASKAAQQPPPPAQQQSMVMDAEPTATATDADDCSPTKNSTADTASSAKGTSVPSPAKSSPSTEQNSQGESQEVEKMKSEGLTAPTASPSLNQSQASLQKDEKETYTEPKQEEAIVVEAKQESSGEKDDLKDSPAEVSIGKEIPQEDEIPQEFIEMAEGIASFFDQALPTRLLYRQEVAQLRVIDAILPEEYQHKRLTEIYGGEHLLRLFIRLPEALVDGFAAKAAAAAAARRSKNKNTDTNDAPLEDPLPRIFALLSDFARFLHKHQSTLFCQSHRKWTAVELKEQQRMIAQQQRRIARATQQQQQKQPTSATSATTSASKHDVDEGKVEADSLPLSSQGGRKRLKSSPK
jgi:MRG